jgi:hypothetical protein
MSRTYPMYLVRHHIPDHITCANINGSDWSKLKYYFSPEHWRGESLSGVSEYAYPIRYVDLAHFLGIAEIFSVQPSHDWYRHSMLNVNFELRSCSHPVWVCKLGKYTLACACNCHYTDTSCGMEYSNFEWFYYSIKILQEEEIFPLSTMDAMDPS